MKKSKEKKKRGFFRIFLGTITALISLVILSAAGLGIYLYLNMKNDPVTVNSLEEYINTPADTEFRHLSFSKDGWMTQTFDDSDVRYFLARYLKDEGIDLQDYFTDTGIDGLSYEGFTAHLIPGQLEIPGVGRYKSIRLVARILMDITMNEGVITAVPAKIRIAGVSVPVSLIDRYLKTDIGSQVFEYQPEEVFLSSIGRFSVEEGSVSFSGPMNTYLIDDAPLLKSRLMLMRLGLEEIRYAGSAIDSVGTDPAVRYRDILEVAVQKPEEFIEFLRHVFSITTMPKTIGLGIQTKNYAMAERWYPDFNANDFVSLSNEVYDKYYVLYRFMKNISGSIASGFSSGRLRVRGDGIYYNGNPFSAKEFFGSNYKFYTPFFELEEGKMCTVRKQAGARQYAGMLIRGADDHGYLMVFYGEDSYDILEVKEEVFQAAMNSSELTDFNLSARDNFEEGLPG